MRILSYFLDLTITYLIFYPDHHLFFVMPLYLSHISGGYFMDYLKRYKKMISLH